VCSVRVICDNSACSTAVKSFKIKLKRKIYVVGEPVTLYAENK